MRKKKKEKKKVYYCLFQKDLVERNNRNNFT